MMIRNEGNIFSNNCYYYYYWTADDELWKKIFRHLPEYIRHDDKYIRFMFAKRLSFRFTRCLANSSNRIVYPLPRIFVVWITCRWSDKWLFDLLCVKDVKGAMRRNKSERILTESGDPCQVQRLSLVDDDESLMQVSSCFHNLLQRQRERERERERERDSSWRLLREARVSIPTYFPCNCSICESNGKKGRKNDPERLWTSCFWLYENKGFL